MLAGLAGGFIAGFLGGGGGIIYILAVPPALVHLGGIHGPEVSSYIVANSIFSIAITTFSGSVAHLRLRSFYLKETLVVGVAGAVCSILLLQFFVNTDHYSPLVFNAIVVSLLLIALLNGFSGTFLNETQRGKPYGLSQLTVAGGAAGAISALSGLGGGLVFIPMMKYWLRMGIMKAKAISLGMIFITTCSMSVFNLFFEDGGASPRAVGLILLPIVLPIAGGVVVGAPLGVWSAHRLKSKVVNRAFLVLMAFVFLTKLLDLLSLLR